MKRIFLVLVIAAAALAVGMGVVGAQEQTNASNESGNVTAEVEFSDSLRVVDYELKDGTARITFDADQHHRVTVSDALAGVGEDGAIQVPKQGYSIDRGQTTISMDVTELRGGSSVGVTVDGKTARLSSEFAEQEPHDPLQYFGGISGLFTGIGMSVGIAVLAAGYVVKREDSGVIQA